MESQDFKVKILGSSRNKYIWSLLIFLFVGILFVGFGSPHPILSRKDIPNECPKGVYSNLTYECGDFDISTHPILALSVSKIKPSNEFLVLEAIPILQKDAKESNITLEIETSAFMIGLNQNILRVLEYKIRREVNFECEEEGGKVVCESGYLIKVTEVQESDYMLVMKILNREQLQKDKVADLSLSVLIFNPTFQKYLTSLKWVLFVVAIFNFIFYQVKLFKFASEFRSDEQFHVQYMTLVLIIFTEPFIKYSTMAEHFVFTTITVIAVSAQSALLTLFWFYLIERLASCNNKTPDAIKIHIKILTIVHFLMSTVAYTTLASDQLQNPILDLQHDVNVFTTICRYYLYLFVIIAVIWSITNIVQVIPRLKKMSWRDSSSLIFTFGYVICYLFFIVTGTLQPMNLKGIQLIALYGITTIYTVILSIIHTPFAQEVEEAEKKRKYNNSSSHIQYSDIDLNDMSIGDSKLKKEFNEKKKDDEKTFDEEEVAI